jgi:predicted tellurium resistance membrane protein TerC
MAGGLLLFWIAIKLLVAEEASETASAGNSLFEAVKIVAIADIVMSLDNVWRSRAPPRARPEQRIWLIVIGLLISIHAGRVRCHSDRGALVALPILV